MQVLISYIQIYVYISSIAASIIDNLIPIHYTYTIYIIQDTYTLYNIPIHYTRYLYIIPIHYTLYKIPIHYTYKLYIIQDTYTLYKIAIHYTYTIYIIQEIFSMGTRAAVILVCCFLVLMAYTLITLVGPQKKREKRYRAMASFSLASLPRPAAVHMIVGNTANFSDSISLS